MTESIQQRLLRRAKPYQTSKLGPSLNDIAQMELSEALYDDLRLGLQSGDFDATKSALFFCQGLLQRPANARIFKLLESEIPSLLCSEIPYLRGYVVPLVVAAREYLPNFRETMLKLLADPDHAVRTAALLASDTFLRRGEIAPLIPFQWDTSVSETEAMGGPWRYIFRDEALLRIENLASKSFRKFESSESTGGRIVFWWDWQPFIDWWAANQR